MTKYLLLYFGGGMPETEAETAKVLKAWEDWYRSLGKAVVDPGHPIAQVATIAGNGSMTDGSTSANVTGYTILQAESYEHVVSMAKKCPVLQGGSDISIFETFEVM